MWSCMLCEAVYHKESYAMSICMSCQAVCHVKLYAMSSCMSWQAICHVKLNVMSSCMQCQAVCHFKLYDMSRCMSCQSVCHVKLYVIWSCMSCQYLLIDWFIIKDTFKQGVFYFLTSCGYHKKRGTLNQNFLGNRVNYSFGLSNVLDHNWKADWQEITLLCLLVRT